MRIDIAGWSTSGLRCPDVAIDLIGSAPATPKVTLLQMPNGTGKTTTLEMLIATLSGVATSWDEKIVRSYRRKGDDRDLGTFVVSLLVDGRPLSIELVLDFEMGTARYRTTNPGSGGVVQSWAPPPLVRRFLAKERALLLRNGHEVYGYGLPGAGLDRDHPYAAVFARRSQLYDHPTPSQTVRPGDVRRGPALPRGIP
ncbi:MAG: hypothetical protein B7Z15_21465, partial [Rhizobiales bacterium 32-66-8]